jgi:glycosyltransferase involved in cell wall biosynthesis
MKLLVLVPEKISEWVAKGEVVDRYYNPGNLFDEVHVCICTLDNPDISALQRMVGDAKLHVRSFKLNRFTQVATLGLQPFLLRFWARKAVKYARVVEPDLVRCHGALQNAYVAKRIKASLGVPYLVSLHTNPDVDLRNRPAPILLRAWYFLTQSVERSSLRSADLVMPVYEPILPYLERLRVPRVKVHYNVINSRIRTKSAWNLSCPPRLLYVGRTYSLKNPIEIIRALKLIPTGNLTIVGNGPLHESLVRERNLLGLEERITFIPAASNDEVCDLLHNSDLFVVHSEHWEISKAVLEALLTGLPIVINKRNGLSVPELNSTLVTYVDNNPESYARAISDALASQEFREAQGRLSIETSWARWSPEVTEQAYINTYRQFLAFPKSVQD